MIFSITHKCNLHCKGCYHQALRQSPQAKLSEDKVRSIVAEAKELGISFIVVGGGEPLIRREILNIIGDFPEILFLVFTNGLLIDEELAKKMKNQKNLVPVISLEGYDEDTDERRGKGVYERVQRVIDKIKRRGIFWGTSLTLTRSNFAEVTDEHFVKKLVDLGCRLFFFVEYNPIMEGTEEWVLSEEQRASILSLRDALRSKFSALFVAIPGDEDEIGGCLSAGRGFVHISAEGNVEPCPFVPYSDASLKELSLKEALQSKFLSTIRQNHKHRSETGGCSLWEKREWVQSLLHTK
jgi:MoaA/NifB/PqqE/SkfB family radical SAM enzyme